MALLSDRQLRILEITGRYFLAAAIIVFVVTAVGTYMEIQGLKELYHAGNYTEFCRNIDIQTFKK